MGLISRGSFTVLHAALATVASGAVGAAGAQEPRDTTARRPAAADTARVARVVVTGVRTPVAVGGASAVVLRADSLRTSPAPVLEQALRETPFVLVRQNSRGEIELSVRGSDSRQAAIMVDGMPLTLGWDHRTDPSLVPLSGTRHIVVVRGLSSLLYGPNVLGGVVDLAVGRDAADVARAGPRRSEAWIATGVDQYGGRALSAGGEAPLRARGTGSLALRAGAGYRQREGFRVTEAANDPTAAHDLRTNSDLRHLDAFASLRWQSPAGRQIGLTATGYHATRGVPPELHVQEPRLWRYPDQSRVLTALFAGTGVIATPAGSGSLEATVGYAGGRSEIESFTDRAYTTLDTRELGDERVVTARLLAAHSLMAGGELRAAFTGGEVRHEETLGEDAPSQYRQRLWSAATEAQWPVLSRGVVSGGVAYDVATTPEAGGKPTLGRLDAWGWRVGATVRATDALRLHTSVSRRARFPALRELYSGALDRFQPNPSLRPERLTAAELGATLAGDDGRVAVQGVVFHHRLEDAVVRTTVPETRLFVRVNRDEIRSSGAELLAAWTSSPMAPRRAVSLTGDLLAQHVRVRDRLADAERRPEHQPEVRGSLELGVPLPLALRGTAAARYTGTQYCVHPDAGTQVRLGAQTKGDLALERSWLLGRGAGLVKSLRALVALDNVADATVYDQCGLPQPGRTLRAGVQLR
ncbi:MAG: TonB-dependent receptor plug domain-containing protein [Gemmatimonadaceae bacterium]